MDEGLIYEEGPPEQIFENPCKEKTRAFINRVRSFKYHIDSPNFDLYKLNAELELFCEKHVFSKKMVSDLQLIVEELLTLYKAQSAAIDVELSIAYSEKHDNIEIFFESAGEEGNVLEQAEPDDIGVMIIENKVERIEFRKVDGKSRLSMFLNKVQ